MEYISWKKKFLNPLICNYFSGTVILVPKTPYYLLQYYKYLTKFDYVFIH